MDTILSESVGFNKAAPTILLLDINSCFATIEQQANPLLRGKPVVVGAYTTDRGCILAASREAKKLGIKTGMYVGDAKHIYPKLVVLPPDPDKYRFVNKKLVHVLSRYTDCIEVKSIDEMIASLKGMPVLQRLEDTDLSIEERMLSVAKEIKARIREEIGEWITVSIGIAPNRYLAKIGSNHIKPDGLTLITGKNILEILESKKLDDLTGIKEGMVNRLRLVGIRTPLDFYNASIRILKLACQSIVGYHWWLRLHGWEADDREFVRRTIGHQHALRKPLLPKDVELKHILYQLILKMGRRLRTDHLTASGIHVSCYYRDGDWWAKGEKQKAQLYADVDFCERAEKLLSLAPEKLIRVISVSCFDFAENLYAQQTLFESDHKKEKITQALDTIAERWGEFTVIPGRLINVETKVQDKIGFGSKYSIDFSMRGVI